MALIYIVEDDENIARIVKEYLEQNGYVISQIAVELNEEILPKTEYVSTVLKDGDVMEIVSFIGG